MQVISLGLLTLLMAIKTLTSYEDKRLNKVIKIG